MPKKSNTKDQKFLKPCPNLPEKILNLARICPNLQKFSNAGGDAAPLAPQPRTPMVKLTLSTTVIFSFFSRDIEWGWLFSYSTLWFHGFIYLLNSTWIVYYINYIPWIIRYRKYADCNWYTHFSHETLVEFHFNVSRLLFFYYG